MNARLLSLLIFLISCTSLQAQRDFSELKADILEATSEFKRLEGIITLGSVYNRSQIDSIHYYADSLSNADFENKEFAEAGRLFLEGLVAFHEGDLQKAIDQLEISRGYFENNGSKNLLIRTLNFLGIAYTRTNEVEQALNIQDLIINLVGDDPEYLPAKSSAYGNKANAYRRIGDFANAIYSLEKAIEYVQGDSTAPMAISYMSMGQMLTSLRMYDRALEAYKTIQIDKIPSASIKGAIYSGLAQTHRFIGNLDSAYYYFSKSFDITSQSGNWQQTLTPQLEMAKIALENHDLELLEKHLLGADTLRTKYRYPPPFFVDLYLTRLKYQILKKNYKEAIKIANEFESFINEKSIVHLSKDGFRVISNLYQILGDNETALKYEKLNSDVDSSPVTISENTRVAEQRTQLALLEKDEIIEQESSQKAFFQNLTIQIVSVCIVLLIISFFLLKYYRKEKLENVIKDNELKELKHKLNLIAKDSHKSESIEHISLKSKALINLNDLNYISSDGPYLEFHLKNRNYPEIDRNTLKNVLEELPAKKFIQVHRSHIVNIDAVKSIYSNKVILTNGTHLNVSRSYKDQLDQILYGS